MVRQSITPLLAFCICLITLTAFADASDRPNIVIMLADDAGYSDFACNGGKTIRTPHIDQLAKDGLRFTDFYAPAPNCSPSRAGMLTGRTPSRVGLYSYINHGSPMHLRESERIRTGPGTPEQVQKFKKSYKNSRRR